MGITSGGVSAGPLTAATSSQAGSTLNTVNVGAAAGRGTSRRFAQPTPVCRCGSSPARHAGQEDEDPERLYEQPLPWSLAKVLRRQVDDLEPRVQGDGWVQQVPSTAPMTDSPPDAAFPAHSSDAEMAP